MSNGVTPWDLKTLKTFKGFGPKTNNLMLTEIFGCFSGVPSDKHVHQGVVALKFAVPPKRKNFTPRMAEASLRCWVDGRKLPTINRTMGAFAQLFTQLLAKPDARKAKMGHKVMDAMVEYLHQDHHIELLWCCIRLVRKHYLYND